MIEQARTQSEVESLRRALGEQTPDNPACFGWRSFSQCDEDGIVRECLRRISTVTKMANTFIEIGCGEGLQNNTHQLLLDGFRGCWVDANLANIENISAAIGGLQHSRLSVQHAFLSLENIETCITECVKKLGGEKDLDFLSLDTDRNDIHFVRAISKIISPKLVCVEYNAKFPPPTKLEMKYCPDHTWKGDDYFGASLQSWVDALDGYLLVSCSLSGTNAFFVRHDCESPFKRYRPEELYQPPRYWLTEGHSGHPSSMRWLSQTLKPQDRREAGGQYAGENPFKAVSNYVFKIALPGIPEFDFEIHAKCDQYISTEIAQNKIWEPFETSVFHKLCCEGDFVLDIGANIGWYSVIGSFVVGKTGQILAFEPESNNFEILHRNLQRCGETNVQVVRAALGAVRTESTLYLSDTNRGDHRLFSDETSRVTVPVKTDTLDQILADRARLPEIVKSDTQGSEGLILRGAARLLANGWRPVWLLEFWPFGLRNSGTDPMELVVTLRDIGYQFFEVSEQDQKLVETSFHTLSERVATDLHPDTKHFINLLVVPRGFDRLAKLKDLF